MGGMPGVRRDVLQWLVSLNLSFPIRNMKREFSNGFLIAEIFSRYFPNSIQMHSFDTGTGIAKKRNNWSQLDKFFKKKNFHILKEEIESIINCDPTGDGAGPLLDRMYGFLTHKRCTQIQIDGNAQDLWLGRPHSAEEPACCNTENCVREAAHAAAESCFDSQRYYGNGYDNQSEDGRGGEECRGYDSRGHSYRDDSDPKRGDRFTRVDGFRRQDDYHEDDVIKLNAYKQEDRGVREMQDYHGDCQPTRSSSRCSDSNPVLSAENIGDHRDSWMACPEPRHATAASVADPGSVALRPHRENMVYFEHDARSCYSENLQYQACPEGNVMTRRDENNLSLLKSKVNTRESPKRVVALSAVERARLKENQRSKQSAKERLNPRVVEQEALRWKQQANRDAGLAFRSPNRQRQYRSYTLADWRKQQSMTGHVQLGGLGPRNTAELDVQRETYQKVKQFARTVQATNTTKDSEPHKAKKVKKFLSTRAKAKEFASKIPKPKPKKAATSESADPAEPECYYTHLPSELEILETQYHADKQKFEAMRKDLEHFLR